MKAIVAVDSNWAIGCHGELLVSLPEDQKDTFRRLTLGNTIIYGRKTLCTFPGEKLLPGRTNIILSRNPAFEKEGAIILHSNEEVLAYCRAHEDDEIFLIGGEQVYNSLLPNCSDAIVSRIAYSFSADAFFPNLDTKPGWKEVSRSEVIHSVRGYDFEVYFYHNNNIDQ